MTECWRHTRSTYWHKALAKIPTAILQIFSKITSDCLPHFTVPHIDEYEFAAKILYLQTTVYKRPLGISSNKSLRSMHKHVECWPKERLTLLHTSNQLWWTAERTGLFVFALPWPFKDNVKVMVRRKNKTLCTRTRREGGFDLIIRTRKNSLSGVPDFGDTCYA